MAIVDLELDQTLFDIERSILEESLYEYTRAAWPYVVPAPLQDNWHIGAQCEHLQAVSLGQILWLLITEPPRVGKSTLASVMWPTWTWARPTFRPTPDSIATAGPEVRFLYSSYDFGLAARDAQMSRQLMDTQWYQERWGRQADLEHQRFKFTTDQNVKTFYTNDKGGARLTTAIHGSVTGKGGDIKVVDDPHDINKVDSDITRPAVAEWWDHTWSTRANDPKVTPHVLVLQCSHPQDLSQHVLRAADAQKWVRLDLPMRYIPPRTRLPESVDTRPLSERVEVPVSEVETTPNPMGWVDPRTEDGELLWPSRFGEKEVQSLELTLGPIHAAAQLQQRPKKAQGGQVTSDQIRYWRTLPPEVFEPATPGVNSWDMTFGISKDSKSQVCGNAWKRVGARAYLLGEERGKMAFPEALDAVRNMARDHPYIREHLVEKKANGQATIDTLGRELSGVTGYEPRGSKEARFGACTVLFRAFNVWVPDPDLPGMAWVRGWVAEICGETAGINDRQDCTSQALDKLFNLQIGRGPLQIYAVDTDPDAPPTEPLGPPTPPPLMVFAGSSD